MGKAGWLIAFVARVPRSVLLGLTFCVARRELEVSSDKERRLEGLLAWPAVFWLGAPIFVKTMLSTWANNWLKNRSVRGYIRWLRVTRLLERSMEADQVCLNQACL
jgi:hypothetical protein